MTATARELIAKLHMQAHPEGGWYAETWRAPAPEGQRPASTVIHFLLETGQSSHWHKVDAAEIWLWHGGDPLELRIAETEMGPVISHRLGPDVLAQDAVQAVVPPHAWQAAAPLNDSHGYSLVSCVVAPGFEFAGFELAPQDWAPGQR